ncbi:MAG: DUF882 domain-containing protein [Deltaproteobacteria bacterium]|nr:DUF882 domain-containing protein [Deltaproteobacteria bacterium]
MQPPDKSASDDIETKSVDELRERVRSLEQKLNTASKLRQAMLEAGLSEPFRHGGSQASKRLVYWLITTAMLSLCGYALWSMLQTTRSLTTRADRRAVQQARLKAAKAALPAPRLSPQRLVVVPLVSIAQITRAALFGDDSRLVVGGTRGELLVYSLIGDQIVAQTELARQPTSNERPAVSALAIGDQRIFVGARDGAVTVFDRNLRHLQTLRKAGPAVRALALGADWLAVAGESSEIEILALKGDRPSTKLTLPNPSADAWTFALATDGRRLVSGGTDGLLRLWDVTAGKPLATLKHHRQWISALAWHPKRNALVSAAHDKQIVIWDLARQQPRHILRGHVRQVAALAFSADGNWLLGGGVDRRLTVWQVESGLQRYDLRGHRFAISAVGVARSGRFFFSTGGSHTLRLWPLPVPGANAPVAELAAGMLRLRLNTSGESATIRILEPSGAIHPPGLQQLSQLVRSGPDDRVHPIDQRVVQLLYRIADHFGRQREITIISGFRSAQYNRLRTQQSRQVAQNSRHIAGQALDIRIDGVTITRLRDVARAQKAGGVGFYADSQFVHIDVGPVRYWLAE